MKLVGLNGTTIWPLSNGRISQYFTEGYFPFQWTYRKQAWKKMLALMPKEPYVLTGFSAGATLCHQIAPRDYNCKGIIVHSGQFREPPIVRRNLPILLLRTMDDMFNVYEETGNAYDWYGNNGFTLLSMYTLPRTTWHGHQYSNGLDTMRIWCSSLLNYNLPLK